MNECPVQTLWCCTQLCGDMLRMSTFTGVCISTVSDMEQDHRVEASKSFSLSLCMCAYGCMWVHVSACGCMWVHVGVHVSVCGCMWVCM